MTDDPTEAWRENTGLVDRSQLVSEGKEFKSQEVLFLPCFLTEKLIPADTCSWEIQIDLMIWCYNTLWGQ